MLTARRHDEVLSLMVYKDWLRSICGSGSGQSVGVAQVNLWEWLRSICGSGSDQSVGVAQVNLWEGLRSICGSAFHNLGSLLKK